LFPRAKTIFSTLSSSSILSKGISVSGEALGS